MAKMVLTTDGNLYARFFIEETYTPVTSSPAIPVVPSDYTGLTWWFKADELSASFSQSQAIPAWTSSISSSTYFASNATVATQPYYTETHFPSGNPSVYFERANLDRMDITNTNFGLTMSIQALTFPQEGVDTEFLSYNPLGTYNDQIRVFNGNSVATPVMFYAQGGSAVMLANTFSSSFRPRLFTVVLDTKKRGYMYEGHKIRGQYINGTTRVHNFQRTNFNLLGKESTSNTYCFTGSMAEFCAWSQSYLTEDDLINLYETYWKPKYPDLVPLGELPSSDGVDPTTISGHRFSFIADDVANIQLTGSGGDEIYGWSSSYHDAGGPYTASQLSSTRWPKYETNVMNGHAGVYIDYTSVESTGKYLHMQFSALTGSTDGGTEVFYVCRRDNTGIGATEYTLTGAPTNWGGNAESNHHTWVTSLYYDNHFSNTRFNWPIGRYGEMANRYVLNFGVATGSYEVFFNGSGSYTNTGSFTPQWTDPSSGGAAAHRCVIGRGTRDTSGTYMYWGYICEIVHFNRKLTTQERQDVTDWLRNKYKIYDG